LNASVLLWRIGKLGEAERIADIWSSTPVSRQYQYVFYTAFDAASTQDERVLPMLRACLRDKEGKVYVWVHAMEVKWPLSHKFLWGVYGPKGLPVLAGILHTSKNQVELESAATLLTEANYIEALPRIRRLAAGGKGDLRRTAIRCLGEYGHPEDFDFLVSGLSSKNAKDVYAHLYALYEYEDLRAVPHIIPCLEKDDESVRREAISCLSHLITPASLTALYEYSSKAKDEKEKQWCEGIVEGVLLGGKLTWESYSQKSDTEKNKFLLEMRDKVEARFKLKDSDKKLTRKDFIEATEVWKKHHRMGDPLGKGSFDWVEARHILAVADAGDIDRLLEVKAAVLCRLSDECLSEANTLNLVVRRLGRARYRKVAGICEKVSSR